MSVRVYQSRAEKARVRELADAAADRREAFEGLGGLEVRFPRPLEDYQQRLMDTLGVRVVIDPSAPASDGLRPWAGYRQGKRRR